MTPPAIRPSLVPGWVRHVLTGRPRRMAKDGVCAFVDLWDRFFESDPLLPPARLRVRVGCFLSFLKAREYRAIGEEFLRLFRRMAPLHAETRLLDIGCGCGQIAVPLTRILTEGVYDGFDPDEELIAWCRQAISSRHPHFRFASADVSNSLYNPAGAVAADRFVFPFSSAAYDVILLKSVFTHMELPGLRQYLREIARMLVPGGVCIATFFVLSDASREGIATGRASFAFPHAGDGCRLQDELVREYLVAYDEAMLRQAVTEAGLRMRPGFQAGSWSGLPAESFQDVVALEHAG
jgi:SAM-dependent methyltransferase